MVCSSSRCSWCCGPECQLSRRACGDTTLVHPFFRLSTLVDAREMMTPTTNRFLRPTGVASTRRLNQIIHSTSIDLLQVLVSHGEVDTLTVEIVKATVIQKLYFCVARGAAQCTEQASVPLALVDATASNQASTTTGNRRSGDGASQESTIEGASQEKGNKLFSANALLVQAVIDGLATPTNRPVLQHWLDFILTTIPQFLRVPLSSWWTC
jgi:hypothetical protein